ncbi:MAG: GH32 C-terminal domain-containing protein [Armatimonadetes bacterium]|nr:GH32 C-terminal domain-containing protein [Armatimonadota bacterium]
MVSSLFHPHRAHGYSLPDEPIPFRPLDDPQNDTFDGRAFYAAKTASDGQRRFLLGWIPTRDQEKDYHAWHWGGNLVVQEIIREPDGTLSVRVPETIDRVFGQPVPFRFTPGLGRYEIGPESLLVSAPDGFGCAPAGSMPSLCKIEAVAEFSPNARGCGIMLRASGDLESACYIRLEPGRSRLVLGMWSRPGDAPRMAELESPLDLAPGKPVPLKVFVDGSVCEVYAAEKIAMSARLYTFKKGDWGVFVNEGEAAFREFHIKPADTKRAAPAGRVAAS